VPIHRSVEREVDYDGYQEPRGVDYQQAPPQGDFYTYQRELEPTAQPHVILDYQQQPDYYQQDQYSNQYVRDDQDYQQRDTRVNYRQERLLSNHRTRSPSLFDAPIPEYKGMKANTYTIDTGAQKTTFTLYT
jgi:hypothetical protein